MRNVFGKNKVLKEELHKKDVLKSVQGYSM